ncbi:protease pro-enzyme activation domain-containing protein [Microlunatus sp. Gsoil 973]|uniref:S53 family peptidase n=1 Tax=Microlunatus sp. Gsoil 973 TaxID=2672569 RepID=UPI001E2FCD3A|nr:S53 family peptidase [Microlunatus sp. Gsoil 973]
MGLGTATATAGPTARTPFPGSVPKFVAAANDSGTTSDSTVEGLVFLDLQDELGAQQFAAAVSTPGSKQYGKYLSPQDWITRFAPTQQEFDTVKQYLVSSGLSITGAPQSREYIVFRGPADATNAAFNTKLHDYKVSGKTVSAPSTAPSLPRSVAAHVLGVSLGDAPAKLNRPSITRPGQGIRGAKPAQTGKATTRGLTSTGVVKQGVAKNSNQSTTSDQCSSYAGEYETTMPEAYGKTTFPTYICGYLPSQLRSAGNLNRLINSGYDGSGVTIGIVDAYASPTILQDTNDYMRAVGSPLLTKFTDISYPASSFSDEALCQFPSGWQTEQTLDIESAHSIAPGANIVYSGGYNCGGGITLAVSKILDQGLADIVSNSYGYRGEDVGDDLIRGEQNLHLQAAGEGIGLYYSTGDDGDNSVVTGQVEANWPATSPWVTAVGGTSEAIGARGDYLFETGWGTILNKVVNGAYEAPLPGGYYGGQTGGGISSVIAQPSYQQGVVPTSLSGRGSQASRVEPDVADLADPYTGFLIALRPIIDDSTLETGPLEFGTIGGTSLATPITAAKMALVQQVAGRQIGFANPLLYQQYRLNRHAFHDVKPPATPWALAYVSAAGNRYLATTNVGFSLFTAKGYDDMTGIGTLKVPELSQGVSRSVFSGHKGGHGHRHGDSTKGGHGKRH